MEKKVYKNYEELPLMLTVPDMAAVLGVSRAGVYELAHSEEFPVLKVGSRIAIPELRSSVALGGKPWRFSSDTRGHWACA